MSCAVCARPATSPVHPECAVAEALAAVAELIAIVVAPTVVVWAG